MSEKHDPNEPEKVALNDQQAAVVSIPNDEDDEEYPKDFLPLSIATTLCCCFVFGMVAVISSVKSREAKRVDDVPRAKKFSNFAKLFNLIAIIVGTIIIISVTVYAINAMIDAVKDKLNNPFPFG